jgi:hypothetical protein
MRLEIDTVSQVRGEGSLRTPHMIKWGLFQTWGGMGWNGLDATSASVPNLWLAVGPK